MTTEPVHGRATVNAAVGVIVGMAGGLIGLGGAELRLPYLMGALRLSPHEAVRVNLAVSLCTILAAIPVRLAALPNVNLAAYFPEATALTVGAVVAAYVGAGYLRRLSAVMLARIISALLVVLGIGLLVEALAGDSVSAFPDNLFARIAIGLLCGLAIGAISSVLGVAGGEVIIPTLVFGYGVPIKAAGSLSMLISLPTVLTGLIRHVRSGFLSERAVFIRLILPMGIGSAAGAIAGGLMVGIVPAAALKVGLGALLIWSASKILKGHQPGRVDSVAL